MEYLPNDSGWHERWRLKANLEQARAGAFLAPEGQGWHEAYLENLERIVGPSWPRAAE